MYICISTYSGTLERLTIMILYSIPNTGYIALNNPPCLSKCINILIIHHVCFGPWSHDYHMTRSLIPKGTSLHPNLTTTAYTDVYTTTIYTTTYNTTFYSTVCTTAAITL